MTFSLLTYEAFSKLKCWMDDWNNLTNCLDVVNLILVFLLGWTERGGSAWASGACANMRDSYRQFAFGDIQACRSLHVPFKQNAHSQIASVCDSYHVLRLSTFKVNGAQVISAFYFHLGTRTSVKHNSTTTTLGTS